jgi:Nitrogen regulatory protein PII
MAEFALICCVVNIGDSSKVLKFARKYGIKEGIVSIGKGTLNSRLLTFLKINEIRKEIVSMIVEGESAFETIKGISEDMAFEKPHHGIAFMHSVSGLSDDKHNFEENTKKTEVKNCMYSAIYIIVERGKAEDVIEVANNAGSRGGTIVNARSAGSHETQKLFSLEIEPEKEKIIIIAKTELKDNIITAVKNHLNLDEPDNCTIFVLDVNEVYGLHQG